MEAHVSRCLQTRFQSLTVAFSAPDSIGIHVFVEQPSKLLKWKTNNWAGAELAPLNHPRTVYLLNPVCAKITTSFAMMTSPGGRNEAVRCSAADRGWGNRRLRLARPRCSIKEKLTEPSQQSAPLDQISDWLCKVIPATKGGRATLSLLDPNGCANTQDIWKVFKAGCYRLWPRPAVQTEQIPKKWPIYPPAILSVLPISCAPRMQSSLDSGTLPQFGCNKGVVPRTPRARAFPAGSFTYKTDRPICLGAGFPQQSLYPQPETPRSLALEFCRGRD